jgi:hypothetical protein
MEQLMVLGPAITPTTPTPLPPLQCILPQNFLVLQLLSTLVAVCLHRLPPRNILLVELLLDPGW